MIFTDFLIAFLGLSNVSTLVLYFVHFKAKQKKENIGADIIELDYTKKIIEIYNGLSADQRAYYDVRINELNAKIEKLKITLKDQERFVCKSENCPNRLRN